MPGRSVIQLIFRRHSSLLTLATAIALLGIGLTMTWYLDRSYRQQKVAEIDAEARVLAATVSAALASSDQRAGQEYVNALAVNPEVEVAAVYYANGKPFVSFVLSPGDKIPHAGAVHPPVFRDSNVLDVIVPIQQAAAPGTVYLRNRTEPIFSRIERYGLIVALFVMASLLVAVLGLAQRVAARIDRVQALAAQHVRETAFLATVIQATPYAELVVDDQGIIVMLNSAAEVLFGYQRDELIGRRLDQLLPQRWRESHAQLRGDFMASPSARAMGRGRDVTALRKDGTEVPVEIDLAPLDTPSGPAVIAGILDITVRKQSELALLNLNNVLKAANQDLIQANALIKLKNEEVEAFVYIVSHDLRSPLITLQGFSRELELACAELFREIDAAGLPEVTLKRLHTLIKDDIDSTLHYIKSSAGKFERLINALLDLSRTGRYILHSEPLDVDAIVAATREALGQLIRNAAAEIEVAPLPNSIGDQTAVGQIFANVIENAVKYKHPDRAPRIEIGGDTDHGMAHYWVRDNGVGIPDTARPRLFHVFQRFHPRLADGDGLGLATVRRLIERHGGTVSIESEPDVGTTFHFTLPAQV